MDEPFTLTPADKISPTWLKLEEYLNQRLEAKRRQNDARGSESDKDFLCGEIAQIKAFLALGRPGTGS